jgi:transposase
MTREFLEKCLAEGLSLEQIAARIGRHPSTVSYHLKKHGLEAVGHDVHSPNGKVDPERLAAAVASGATVRQVANELGVSYSTARYWLKRLGLETAGAARRRQFRDAAANEVLGLQRVCRHHGLTTYVIRPDGGFRCGKCRAAAVSNWRRRMKRRLVERAGGKCELCGYDGHPGALQFHHIDPSTKAFPVSRNGSTRAYAEAEAEADKCVLLCANCHAEVEGGVKRLPSGLLSLRLRSP